MLHPVSHSLDRRQAPSTIDATHPQGGLAEEHDGEEVRGRAHATHNSKGQQLQWSTHIVYARKDWESQCVYTQSTLECTGDRQWHTPQV